MTHIVRLTSKADRARLFDALHEQLEREQTVDPTKLTYKELVAANRKMIDQLLTVPDGSTKLLLARADAVSAQPTPMSAAIASWN